MNRRIGSFFYKTKSREGAGPAPRRSFFGILGIALRKTCMAIGGFVLFVFVMALISAFFIGEKRAVNLPDDMILVLNVVAPIGENEHARSLTDPFAPAGITVRDLVNALDRATTDKRVRGLLVSLDHAGIELTHIQEIRAAVKRFRKSGKYAHIYTASFADLGSGIGAYYLASAFDQIWMQPVGMVSMTGLAIEMPFAKKALDKVGASAQFLHREEYKSAMESFTNEAMSAPNREMMTSIMRDFSAQIFKDIAQDRQLTDAQLQVQLDKGLITGKDALKAGLISHLDYTDVLLKSVQKKGKGKPPLVLLEDYYAAAVAVKHGHDTPNVALVNISGEIIPGSEPQPGYATGDYIASAIQDAGEDKNIKVIVVRVNSPGGSPSASETIRRAIVQAKEKGKKIIVSMGPLAASGGYWITVDADRIFAMPSTLTGSIGVIMGKFEASELWKKIGVNWDGVSWGQNARLWSMNSPIAESEKATLNAAIDDTYNSFLERVAKGRRMDKEKVRGLAKGRAWTGLQAKKNGLVDEIGGLDTSLDYAAKIVGALDRTKLNLVILPEPLSPLQELMRLMGEQILFRGFNVDGASMLKNVAPYLHRMDAVERMGPIQAYDPGIAAIRL